MAMNGTIVGSPTFSAGLFGNAAGGFSSSSYIGLPAGWMPSASSCAIGLRVKFSGSGTYVAVGQGTTLDSLFFIGAKNGLAIVQVFAGGGPAFTDPVTGSADITGGSSIADGKWHHLVALLSPVSCQLYVDGVVVATGVGQFAGVASVAGAIGGYTYQPGYVWPGQIDQVETWVVSPYTYNFIPDSQPFTGNEFGLATLYSLNADGTDSNTDAFSVAYTPAILKAQVLSPSSAAIKYSPFNWSLSSGYARTINSGAYLAVIFTGSSVALSFDTSPNVAPYSQVWARVDGQAWQLLTLSAGNPTLSVAYGLPTQGHLLEVKVKSTSEFLTRWASSQTIVQLTGIVLDVGAILRAPLRRTFNVAIFGDSITEGYKTEANSTLPSGSDILGDYADAIADSCDAEVGIVGFGGQGINGGGQGGVPAFPSAYNQIYSGVSRSFTSPAPDLVIYNQGTNDTASVTAGYVQVLQAMIALCPAAKHLVLLPFNGSHASDIVAAIAQVASPNVAYVDTSGWWNPADSSDGTHPWAFAHLALIAPKLLPIVQQALYLPSAAGLGVGFTLVTGYLTTAAGSPLNGATISFQPQRKGLPSGFEIGSTGDFSTFNAVNVAVRNGSFSVVLADTSLANPLISYAVAVTDSNGLVVLSLANFQPAGATYKLSQYTPS